MTCPCEAGLWCAAGELWCAKVFRQTDAMDRPYVRVLRPKKRNAEYPTQEGPDIQRNSAVDGYRVFIGTDCPLVQSNGVIYHD